MPFALALSTINEIVTEKTTPDSSAASSNPKVSTLHFAYIAQGEAKYKFSKNELIVGTSDSLLIDLSPGIPANPRPDSPIDIPNKGRSIDIDSYCCTETDLGRVHLASKSTGKTYPNGHNTVTVNRAQQAARLTSDGKSVQEVLLNFELEPRQLVFVGIIVRVTTPSGNYEWFLCDPQVGNGPPGASKTFEAVALNLV
jgi:hypothetical protein